MLLYWGMFTVGFTIGAVFSFITFAAKKPEEDAEYEAEKLPDQKQQVPEYPILDKSYPSYRSYKSN